MTKAGTISQAVDEKLLPTALPDTRLNTPGFQTMSQLGGEEHGPQAIQACYKKLPILRCNQTESLASNQVLIVCRVNLPAMQTAEGGTSWGEVQLGVSAHQNKTGRFTGGM